MPKRDKNKQSNTPPPAEQAQHEPHTGVEEPEAGAAAPQAADGQPEPQERPEGASKASHEAQEAPSAPPTRASMFVQGFRHHHAFICGHELGGAGGCRQSVEQWHSPNGTAIVVDAMPGDNSPWIVHSNHCPARRF